MSRHAPRMARRPAGVVPALAFALVVAALSAAPLIAHASSSDVDDAGGALTVWGANNRSQSTLPASAVGSAFTDVAAGDDFTIALTSAGSVISFGDAPTAPAGIDDDGIVQVAAGGDHALALTADGTVVTWGSQTSVPSGLTGVTAIAAGGDFDLALTSGGTVVAWGADSSVVDSAATLTDVSSIAAGSDFALAVSGGHVTAWGASGSAALSVPSNLSGVTQVAAGRAHALAITAAGTVTGWGADNAGQTDIPASLGTVSDVAAGGDQSIAIGTDGTVTAWGENSYTQHSIPAALGSATAGPATTVAAGAHHLAAVHRAFVVTPTPQVSGDVAEGSTLSVDPGVWTPQYATVEYQWNADGTPIDGATASTFTTTDAQIGRQLTVMVTAQRAGYPDTSVTSDPTDAVTGGVFTTVSTPAISGTPRVDGALTAVTGSWTPDPDSFGYQWNANGSAITGATGSAYTPTSADVGRTVTVAVTARRAGYASVTKVSSGAVVGSAVFTVVGPPTISGSAVIGQTLTAHDGTWTPTPSGQTYRWFSDGNQIAGATGSTLQLSTATAGTRISVDVTAARGGYASSTLSSATTGIVTGGSFTTRAVPTISGSTSVGNELSAAVGTWSPAPTQVDYQWYAGNTPITGATASTFTTTDAQLGSVITVAVTMTRTGYTAETATSVPTAMIDGGVFSRAASPTPTITGSPVVGHALTSRHDGWNPAARLSLQWYADGEPIAGATGDAFTPTSDQAGSTLTVRVTGSAPGYTTVARTSEQTEAVTGGTFTTHPAARLLGTPWSGRNLVADVATWSPAASLNYRWYVGGDVVVGATADTFTPSADAVGQLVRVVVTGSRPGFTSLEESTSAQTVVGGGRFTLARSSTAITGSSRIGGTLVAPRVSATPTPTAVNYRWVAGGRTIRGATGSRLTVAKAQVGKRIAVSVTVIRAGYTDVTTTSPATRPVGVFWQRQSPTITGSPRVGRVLTAKVAGWSPTPTSISYQWYANGHAIRGATHARYRVTGAVQGRKLTVRVVAHRRGVVSLRRGSSGVWVPQTGHPSVRFG